ncbi:MAG: hypothetical protein LBJ25_02470, partial [Candidatus Margulisbacteria bacterium]|nr:hypothetical protein [Candidatus Margulisiibacteriota bacterium]
MMMHRKIIELKQAGQNYFAQATKLNDALVEKGESLIHLLSAQEQASAQEPIPSLKQKIIILNTVQEITKELDISRLLNQMPPSTIEYLTGALGLTWPEIGEYLTKDNLNKAITRIEKQITQLNIISDAQNEIGSAHDYAAALFLEPLTAADTDNFGNYLTPNGTFHNLIDTYKTNMASAFAINYETLKKLSAGLLAEPQGSSKGLLAGHEYFLELTAELKKALNLSGTDLLVIHGGKEYLAVTSEEDKTLLERKIFAAYLNAYEKALLNNHLNYFERGPSGAVDPQEETEMASGLTKKSKTGKPEDTLKLYKLLSEMAILKYNYKDVDNSEYVWQFYQYEAGTWPNFIKKLGMKKEIEDIGPAIKKWTDDKKHKLQAVPEADLQKIEKELKPGVDKWSRKLIDERKKDDPHNKNPLSPVRARSIVIKNWADADKLKESPAPEERRAGITLPHIDIGALQNGLRGLTGDPRYRRALLALLALLLLAGGG